MMTSDYKTLVDELRAGAGDAPYDSTWEEDLFSRAADAIEALVKERDEWRELADNAHAYSDDVSELIKERDSFKRQAEYFADRGNRAELERDGAEREMHARELHHFEEEQKSAGLAAVIEKAKARAGHDMGCSATSFPEGECDCTVTILSTAPADALREHDAALIGSLADRIYPGPTADTIIAAIRERARQIREGEA